MADKKISELTLSTPNDDDVIPFTDVGESVTYKALKSALKGDTGTAATATAGTTTTLAAGESATVTNVGTTSAAVFNFAIPQGIQGLTGADGDDGAAATIAVGTVTTVANNVPASVTNVGTSAAAIFDFEIPKGLDGEGSGDVIAPATNTDSYIPQWNGANSKTLKDGLAVPTGGLAGLTSPAFTTPNLGTPSAGTLTSCTGLPLTGLVSDTTTALGVGSINLGHASDTTIARVSAGVVSVEGVTVPTISSTSTLTNKRITQRVTTTTDDATAVIDIGTCDTYELSAVANATEISTTGTPTDGQKLMIRLKDAGAAKGLTWTGFTAIGVTLPTTTVAGKWHYIGCVYNSSASAWHALAVSVQA